MPSFQARMYHADSAGKHHSFLCTSETSLYHTTINNLKHKSHKFWLHLPLLVSLAQEAVGVFSGSTLKIENLALINRVVL